MIIVNIKQKDLEHLFRITKENLFRYKYPNNSGETILDYADVITEINKLEDFIKNG